MSVLTTAQQQTCTAKVAAHIFQGEAALIIGVSKLTANAGTDQIQSNVAALDNALDTTVNAAVTAGFGADTIINALAAQLTPPVSGWTAQEKTILLCYVLMERVGMTN